MADVSVTAADVNLPTGAYKTGTAGETITAGQTLYVKAADGELYKADVDNTEATATIVGIALGGASDGQPLSYAPSGTTIDIGGTVAVGTVYVGSDTAGGIKPSTDLATGDYTFVLGVAVTATNIKLSFINSGVQVPA